MSVNKTTDVIDRERGEGLAKDSVKHYYIICLLLKLKPTLPRYIPPLAYDSASSPLSQIFRLAIFFYFRISACFLALFDLAAGCVLLVLQAATLRRRLIATAKRESGTGMAIRGFCALSAL